MSRIREYSKAFNLARSVILQFIADVFGDDASPPLEHIFTALDLSISRNQFLRGRSPAELSDVRGELVACVTLLFHVVLQQYSGHAPARFVDNVGDDDVVLTPNWDLLIDNAIRNKGLTPDYGFPVHWCEFVAANRLEPLQPPQQVSRSILLKLHGSLNWMLCRACDQVIAVRGRKAAHHEYVRRPPCPLCDEKPGKGQGPLISQIVTPTFLKSLAPPHYQQVWSSAAEALRKAKKMVFMGYSLPLADYEIATLIARNLPTASPIRVVLHNCPRDRDEVAQRYRDLFGPGRCRFNFSGVLEWLRTPCHFPEQ
jgi:hypothetical protein